MVPKTIRGTEDADSEYDIFINVICNICCIYAMESNKSQNDSIVGKSKKTLTDGMGVCFFVNSIVL